MKKLILPLSVCFTHIAIANPTSNSAVQPMVNYPARPTVEGGGNLWADGEFLYWQAAESNLPYIYSGTPIVNTPEFQNVQSLHFEWNPGFRVGLGYNFIRDGWDLAAYYTHMHSTASSSMHAGDSTHQLFQVWTMNQTILTPPLTKASGHWHADLDQADLQLGREMFTGKYLTLRPYIGMRSTWLFQEFKVSVQNALAQSQNANMHSRYWGYGFVVGVDSDWLFGKGFSLYANADYSLLLGFFDVDEKSTQNGSPIWKISSSFRAGRSIFDLGAGLKWMHLFSECRYGLTLKAGYEYHLYFDQNQFINTTLVQGLLERYVAQTGNLAYQGISVSVQFDF